MQFAHRVAVITGAGSGIGQAVARALAQQGATLCLIGRNLDRLKATAENLPAGVQAARCYHADVSCDQDIHALGAWLRKEFKQIDILVHSAGVISLGRSDAASVIDFDQQYRVNVRAPYLLTQAMLPLLYACRGQIVFMNSSAGLGAKANQAQYAATKHALTAVADSLREEVNPAGIRVLSVYIGRTATPMQVAVHEAEGKPYHPHRLLRPEDIATVVVNALSLARTAEVTEIRIRPLQKSG
ncbi:MAG: SDR family oxidoreductase [Candidatus Binatia bacterium]